MLMPRSTSLSGGWTRRRSRIVRMNCGAMSVPRYRDAYRATRRGIGGCERPFMPKPASKSTPISTFMSTPVGTGTSGMSKSCAVGVGIALVPHRTTRTGTRAAARARDRGRGVVGLVRAVDVGTHRGLTRPGRCLRLHAHVGRRRRRGGRHRHVDVARRRRHLDTRGASSPSIETDTSTDDAVAPSAVVASFVEAVRVCTPVSTSDVDSELVSESRRGGAGPLEVSADSAGAATATVAPTSTSALTLPMARRKGRAPLSRLRHECSARIPAMSNVYSIADTYVERFAALDPISATGAGIPGHEHELTDYSPAGAAARAELAARTIQELEAAPIESDGDRIAVGGDAGATPERRRPVRAGERLRDLRVIGSPVGSIRACFDLMAYDTPDDWDIVRRRMLAVPGALAELRPHRSARAWRAASWRPVARRSRAPSRRERGAATRRSSATSRTGMAEDERTRGGGRSRDRRVRRARACSFATSTRRSPMPAIPSVASATRSGSRGVQRDRARLRRDLRVGMGGALPHRGRDAEGRRAHPSRRTDRARSSSTSIAIRRDRSTASTSSGNGTRI